LHQYPWLERHIDIHLIDEGRVLAGWNIHSWKVNHGKNGYSYAYRFDKNGHSWAYCPDSIRLLPEQKLPLKGLDLLILGTSFYREWAEFSTRSVYDVTEALELLQEITPKQTIFTHLSHDIDLRNDYQLPESVTYAKTGMAISLS
jgi:phosphoribosyl 1,2-cyclic phosphate phosphodiesterase